MVGLTGAKNFHMTERLRIRPRCKPQQNWLVSPLFLVASDYRSSSVVLDFSGSDQAPHFLNRYAIVATFVVVGRKGTPGRGR